MTTNLAAHSHGEIFAAYLTAILLAVVATMIIGAIAALIRLRLRDRRAAREAAAIESLHAIGKSATMAAAIQRLASAASASAPIRIPIPANRRHGGGAFHPDRHRSVAPASSTPTEVRA